MKRQIFVVAKPGTGRAINNEADLLASLAADYRALLAEFPMRDKAWQIHVQSGNQTEREEIAWGLLHRNRELVAALRDGVPAWEAAHLGMRYQDLLKIYLGPRAASFVGRAYRKGQKGRKPNHELPSRVLKALKGSDMSWKEILRRFERGAFVSGVIVRQGKGTKAGNPTWVFVLENRDGEALSSVECAESTLETKIFPKV